MNWKTKYSFTTGENMVKSGVGVVVGRFQVHELHDGHLQLLAKAATHKKLLVFIGVHPFLVTPSDPLDFPTRERMIKEKFPEAMVVAVPDQPSNEKWSRTLDKTIRTYCPLDHVTLYSGRDGFKKAYSGNFDVFEIDEVSLDSGTEIREQISQEVRSTKDFRAGVVYGAYNKWPTISPTVDVAITKEIDNKLFVLLGQKNTQPGLWRFPGGFIDVRDETAEAAAKRELHEETGLLTDSRLSYIGSYFVKDWRTTPKSKILTIFYHAKYDHGASTPSDDLDVLDWHEVKKLKQINVVPGHVKLVEEFLSYLGENKYV